MSTPEIRGLTAYMEHSGVPHRVTSTLRDQPGSFHHAGRAVDFAGHAPSRDSDELLAVYTALLPLMPVTEELFYAGPGGALWKRGERFRSEPVARAHHDHVHIAVRRHWSWVPSVPIATEEKTVPDDPTLVNITGPAELHLVVDGNGRCTGYYVFSPESGEIHSYGPGAPYHGRSEVVKEG